jgi:amino acid permease
MRSPLTKNDIKELRYQCRMGYILPIILFIFGSFFVSAIALNLTTKMESKTSEITVIVVSGFALLSLFVNYKMNGKYVSDIRNKEKLIETKIIQKKETKRDYEAGSGTLYVGQEMKGFDSFSIVVENYRYRVDKDLFENCFEGDEILFNYAPRVDT